MSDLTTIGQRLRRSCSRVCKAHLALLRTYFTHYGPRARGPFDKSGIERITQDYHKEERRRERILIALNFLRLMGIPHFPSLSVMQELNQCRQTGCKKWLMVWQ
jgi:hypothetical protein